MFIREFLELKLDDGSPGNWDLPMPELLAGYRGPYVPRRRPELPKRRIGLKISSRCSFCSKPASWRYYKHKYRKAAIEFCNAKCFREWCRARPIELKNHLRPRALKPVVGHRVGKVTLLEVWGRDPHGDLWCRWACDCGNIFLFRYDKASNTHLAKTANCGCSRGEHMKMEHFP